MVIALAADRAGEQREQQEATEVRTTLLTAEPEFHRGCSVRFPSRVPTCRPLPPGSLAGVPRRRGRTRSLPCEVPRAWAVGQCMGETDEEGVGRGRCGSDPVSSSPLYADGCSMCCTLRQYCSHNIGVEP